MSTPQVSTLPPLVLGTAGHVDHGKTTLIRWLTGIDTDRLPEEKERGITIELGFAYLDLGEQRLAVVDVPGHERFVRAMVAGVAGIDLVLFVVAADEGVRPQTREHLSICSLLGVRGGVVVLTKVDLVDADWLELVQADLAELLTGTFLEHAPQIHFSAVDEATRTAGVQELRQALEQVIANLPNVTPAPSAPALGQPTGELFRLPVDRVFTLRGFGTVVTGTCISGSLHEGDQVEAYPSGVQARVRGIQSHGASVPAIGNGQRGALNLQGVERREVQRGEVIGRQGELTPTSWVDVRLELLPHLQRPLTTRAPLLLHHGTAQVEAQIELLDCVELPPGGRALAQLRLAQPLVLFPADLFLLRGYNRDEQHGTTVGGGRVLLPAQRRCRPRERPALVEQLTILERAATGSGLTWRLSSAHLLEELVRRAETNGISTGEVASRLGWTLARVQLETQALVPDLLLQSDAEGGLLVHASQVRQLMPRIKELLRQFHTRLPRRVGMEREELLSRVAELGYGRTNRLLLKRLIEEGILRQEGSQVGLASFRPRQDPADERMKQAILRTLTTAGLAPPFSSELATALGCSATTLAELLAELVAEGQVIRVKEEFHVAANPLAALQDRLVKYLQEQREIAPTEFKTLVGGSRKYSIPLAEYFDQEKVTLRVGDQRRLRRT